MAWTIPKRLSTKHKRFAEEWRVDRNGTRAAIRAGYSPKSARGQASTMLAWPIMQQYIAELDGNAMDLTITADRVLKELARIAFHDPAAYFHRNAKGKLVLKELDEMTPDQRAAISEFDQATKKLKLYDKLSALEKIGKHLKLFTELHEQKHTFTIMPVIKRGGSTFIFNVGQPKPQK